MMDFDPDEHPHRRRNPLTGGWVLVSPHRARRPWFGHAEDAAPEPRRRHDPACSLCPGNTRAGGAVNPDYDATFVFTNDFAALAPDTPQRGTALSRAGPLFRAEPVRGECRVVSFSPRHDLRLAEMEPGDVRRVVDVWAEQVSELSLRYRWVQVFENNGALMGCSHPHPHGQIWASSSLPNEPAAEEREQSRHLRLHRSPLLHDYAVREMELERRVVGGNEHWLVVVPFWAVWPFETLLLPRRRVARLPDLTAPERDSLAAILGSLLARYDNLFDTPFPYSMGWHGAPGAGGDAPHWQLHAHFFPPLLRSRTVKKFLVGYEMLAEAQRDLTPEAAALRLRETSDTRRLRPAP